MAKVVEGTWDPGDLIPKRLAEKTKERKASTVREKVFPIYNAGDYKATVLAIDEATSGDPALASEFAWLKFASLCNGGDIHAGLELGEKLFEINKDNPFALNNYFWNVITPKLKNEPDPRVAELALRAAGRAVELTKGENVAHLDTLAEAQFRTGDIDGAISTEEKALQTSRGGGQGANPIPTSSRSGTASTAIARPLRRRRHAVDSFGQRSDDNTRSWTRKTFGPV